MRSVKLIKTSAFGEKNLWQACLMQHIRDMFIVTNTPKTAKIKKEAEEFLLENNTEFKTICILAGYNPEKVRLNIKSLYKARTWTKANVV